MRILIVDNDMISRMTLEKILSNFGECMLTNNVAQAIEFYLESFKYPPLYDAIIIDLDMSEGNGITLVKKIRALEERAKVDSESLTKIIVLTHEVTKDKIIKCSQAGCNSLIVKPFNRNILLQKFEDVGLSLKELKNKYRGHLDLHTMAEELYMGFQSNQLSLPSHPQIAMKFKELRTKEASFKQIEEVLKHDISISAKLIQVANSAMYGGIARHKTLTEAMNRLGLAETEKYVNAISNKRLYENLPRHLFDYTNQLWHHSLACAYAAEMINKTLPEPVSIDPFTLGLMHDIGKLLLLQLFSEIAKKKKAMNLLKSDDFYELMQDMHEKFGAAVLEKWQFPAEFYETVLYHETPTAAPKVTRELALIHLADQLVKSMGYITEGEIQPKLDPDLSFRLLKIRYSVLEDIRYKVDKKVKSTITML